MNALTISKFQLGTAIFILLFWILFFTVGFENPKYPPYYTKFEHSFPLPDGFLALTLFLAFFNRHNSKWTFYTLIASGAMVFLGLVDFAFNIQNGMYCVGFPDGILNVIINLWCVIFGLFQMKTLAKNFV
ncbi:MAG: hypothetical protein C4K58_05785 [Flavobacteriaceae bacterium]|nr:MAG: hypothetical protein C4K58_05785 [Flavobacteriaceae bacterium]